jgi:hypothetical protein
MNRRAVLFSIALSFFASSGVFAQDAQPRKSPHDTVSVMLAGQKVTISYGRPYLRGRQAVGGSLVPYGMVWRTGADEATKLTTPVDLMIGDLKVPAGSYSLFTQVTKDGWTLIVDKTADQWGAFSYDQSQDLGRTKMEVMKPEAKLEQFTISLNKTGDKSTVLSLAWENTIASVPVKAI